jgi:hypothetical protein
MSDPPPLSHDELMLRIARDLADSYDEELEMEIEDHHPLPGLPAKGEAGAEKEYRRYYFQELFRLQAELVKLQDWVVGRTREDRHPVRRTRCCGEGWRHQACHTAAESTRVPRRGIARAE